MITKEKTASSSSKSRLLPLFVLSLLFYGAMLLLSLTSKDIHLKRLPKVTASRLSNVTFSCQTTSENGDTRTVTTQLRGLPKELYDSGQVFTITSKVTDGMTFYYAEQVAPEIDFSKENADYYAVLDSFFQDMVILSGYEELEDGDEVNLIKD